jgi:hypothetical protein
MKVKSKIITSILLLLFLSLSILVTADEVTQNLETRILESFDEEPTSRWVASGSKFSFIDIDENGNEIRYPQTATVNTFPQALFGWDADPEGKNVLGIRCRFTRQGYNYVEIMPVKVADEDAEEKDIVYIGDDGTEYELDPIPISGRVKMFDVWVWGSNYNYYLDAHFEDSWGVSHVIRMGDLDFGGWKNLSANIPGSISQATSYIPKSKPLRFMKFVIWTRPTEVVSDYYVYLDQMKVLTDVFETRFDGDDLVTPDTMMEVWGVELED